jgi:hypothetical protein
MILNELVMNFLSTKHFLESINNKENVLYRKGTYPKPLTDGPGPRQLARGIDRVNWSK